MKTKALAWLVLNVIVLALLCVKTRHGLDLETDILKLLPKTEQNPLAEKAVRTFSETMGNRVIFLVGHEEPFRARRAAADLAERLESSDQLSSATGRMQSDDSQGFYTLYFPHRTSILPPSTIRELSTPKGVATFLDEGKQMLYSPMASALSPLLADDPLLLFPRWIKGLPEPPGESEVSDGFLHVQEGDLTYVMVEAQVARSPFSRVHQAPAVRAIDEAVQHVREAHPGIRIERTGVLFFAYAGSQSAENEVRVIGFGSMLGVVLLILLTFRSPRRLFVSLLPIGSGLLFALTVSLYCFPELHLITLGFGASLIGVCIDYAFHYFADSLHDKDAVDGPGTLRRILPGITLGMITSVLAYMGLFIAPFPGLRQMAVFSSVGLLGAFGTVVAWYPLLMHRQRISYRPRALYGIGYAMLNAWRWLFSHKTAAALLLLLSLYVAGGIFRLRANDDVRQLQTPSPDLVAAEQHIRSLMGNIDLSRFLLIEGSSPDAVLRAEEELMPALEKLEERGALDFHQGLSQWIPSASRQHDSRAALRESLVTHRPAYEAYFSDLGFPPATYGNLLRQLEQDDSSITFDTWFAGDVSAPFRQLWLGEVDGTFASLVLLGGVHDEVAFTQLETAGGVTYVNKVDDVSRLFGRYRKLAGWLVLASYLVIGLFLIGRYGLRKARLVFFPPCIAAVLTLGLLGHMGQPMTLFNGLALLLVLGIGIDYTIFFAEARSDASNIMMAIMLSAFTTLLSFGLLSLSQTQALSRFGFTLLIGITLALLFAPMAAGTTGSSMKQK